MRIAPRPSCAWIYCQKVKLAKDAWWSATRDKRFTQNSLWLAPKLTLPVWMKSFTPAQGSSTLLVPQTRWTPSVIPVSVTGRSLFLQTARRSSCVAWLETLVPSSRGRLPVRTGTSFTLTFSGGRQTVLRTRGTARKQGASSGGVGQEVLLCPSCVGATVATGVKTPLEQASVTAMAGHTSMPSVMLGSSAMTGCPTMTFTMAATRSVEPMSCLSKT